MNAEDYTQGSKPNPFSWNDFNYLVEMERWQCGWIYNVNGQKVYVGGDHLGCPFNGSRINPYPEATFYEMRNHGIWTGGYVGYGEETHYVTSNENPYYGTGELLGSEDNPWPLSLFEELCVNEIWEGGWVTYPNGANYFIDVDMEEPDIEGCGSSGCGCGEDVGCGCGEDVGCGCGEEESGCGCGSDDGYVIAGIDDVLYIEDRNIRIVLSWNSGFSQYQDISLPLTEPPYSYLTVNAVARFPYSISTETSLTATWTGLYEVTVTGDVAFRRYESDIIHYISISRKYDIPNDYIRPVPEL